MMKKDIVWLDYARTIGIFLVVFGHVLQQFPSFQGYSICKTLWNYIYLFHMPLFFIISGFLFKNDSTKPINVKMGGVCKALIIPYLLYQVIYLPIALFMYREKLDGIHSLAKIFAGTILGDGYETEFSLPVNLPCWFIISIVQLRFLFMIIPLNKISSCLLSLVSIFILIILKSNNIDLYFCLDSTLMAIPYFILGHYMAKTNIMDMLKFNIVRLIVALISFVLVVLVLEYNGAAQMNGPSFGKNILLNYSAGVFGSLGIFIISIIAAEIFKRKEYIYRISRNTLFIIFFHWLLLAPIGKVLRLTFVQIGINPTSISILTNTILTSILILHFSKITITRFESKIPVLFGKKTI